MVNNFLTLKKGGGGGGLIEDLRYKAEKVINTNGQSPPF